MFKGFWMALFLVDMILIGVTKSFFGVALVNFVFSGVIGFITVGIDNHIANPMLKMASVALIIALISYFIGG